MENNNFDYRCLIRKLISPSSSRIGTEPFGLLLASPALQTAIKLDEQVSFFQNLFSQASHLSGGRLSLTSSKRRRNPQNYHGVLSIPMFPPPHIWLLHLNHARAPWRRSTERRCGWGDNSLQKGRAARPVAGPGSMFRIFPFPDCLHTDHLRSLRASWHLGPRKLPGVLDLEGLDPPAGPTVTTKRTKPVVSRELTNSCPVGLVPSSLSPTLGRKLPGWRPSLGWRPLLLVARSS